jgi:hypothetical protein
MSHERSGTSWAQDRSPAKSPSGRPPVKQTAATLQVPAGPRPEVGESRRTVAKLKSGSYYRPVPKKADLARWPCSPAWLTVEVRRIAPQLGIPGIISKISGCDQGRVDIEPLPRKMPTRCNPMAEDELGRYPKTPEKCRHAASLMLPRPCRHIAVFGPKTRVCMRSSPPLGLFLLPSTMH